MGRAETKTAPIQFNNSIFITISSATRLNKIITRINGNMKCSLKDSLAVQKHVQDTDGTLLAELGEAVVLALCSHRL